MKNYEVEATKMWELGKTLGVTFEGDENDIIRQIKVMEERD